MPALRPRLVALLVLTAGFAGGAGAASAQTGVDDLLCLRGAARRLVERSARFTPRSAVLLRDRVAGKQGLKIDLRKPLGLCLAARAPGAPGPLAATAFESYAARVTRTRPAQIRPTAERQRVSNRFGTEELQLKGLTDVLATSAATLDPLPAPASLPGILDDRACWEAGRAGRARGVPAPPPLVVESAIGTWQIDVRAPTRLCFPADLDGADPSAPQRSAALACYRAKLTRIKPPQGKPFPKQAATANRFGAEQLTLTAFDDLCVPSDVSALSTTPTPTRTFLVPTPTPTVTPPPTFTLRIDPAAATVDVGESVHLTATAVFENGDTANFTERVVWRSTPAALAPNVAGDRGRIDTVDGGSAVISVLDEATGVTSTASDDDALLMINWTLERIELLPVAITRGQGESVRLRATGHFAHGFTRSIAEFLTYASSAPTIAQPINGAEPADHNRVLAISPGAAVISATDPRSGITSTDSGDDMVLTVVPPLERCEILYGDLALAIGTFYQLTARGYYPGGFERVVTQQVEWTSGNPAIVEAPNTEGDRSRVFALSEGETTVSATDTVTGVHCQGTVLVTVGLPNSLLLQPPTPWEFYQPMRKGRSWHAIAVQKFPRPIEKKYVTEQVEFTSSDPTIVAAPNVVGDRGRLDAVGSGTATVFATDPISGLVSQEIYLRSLDGLTRVFAPLSAPGQTLVINVGATYFTGASGLFADGPAILEADDVTFASDNPAVATATQTGDYWRIQALAPGLATISVTDELTGLSSDAFGDSLRVGVRGALQRLVVLPTQVERRVGEQVVFTVIGHYAGGASEVRQSYQLLVSNSHVAGPSSYPGSRAIEARAGGTANIIAYDPATGVSSQTTGDDAELTVIGPLTRIHVQPEQVHRSVGRSFAFTAIGTDENGRTINVTQDVAWSSSDANVVVAPNEEGNRSKVTALELGTVTVSAYDVQDNVASSDSGEDGTLVVDSVITALDLSSERTTFTVGETLQLTAVGTLSVGPPVNLTQEATYVSSNPDVLVAENTPGDRSRIHAIAPGTAVISAFHGGSGVATGSTGKVTLVVTAP